MRPLRAEVLTSALLPRQQAPAPSCGHPCVHAGPPGGQRRQPGRPGPQAASHERSREPAKTAGVAIVVLLELEQEKIYWMGP